MADLDDFFAKKDRKKPKGVKKFTTTEELAKKLEETHKREREKLKEKKTLSSQNPDGDNEGEGGKQEEDEWREFEEEKKDYTNLKIQNLQIPDTPSGEDGEGYDGEDGEGELEANEAGEMVPRKRQPTGPWKAMSQPEPEPEKEEAKPAPPPPESNTGASKGSSYVPPQKRNNPTAHLSSVPLTATRLKSKAAPDINDETYFPTLSASKTVESNNAWGKRQERGFEEVRNSKSHTSRYDPKIASSGGGPKLSLGNKYDALNQDQS